ncbi:gas vesicle protein GvpJ [Actinopolymorpha singaporensis]|uniref:Gas vesicle protein n=1 Tax=Actinopolymorpha singaporensis TaxID=117157 RepID=A0A1H1V6P5_9ACTN|nr:gas vesicle protein GvpJ [Actinopolymorpha singaporensis]SDS80046.1 Gas vesicle protein [Actinopolymorpha singaporensis]
MADRTLVTGSGGGTSLVDLLDRVVDRGVVVSGDIIISLAGIDLIQVNLRLLLIGLETANEIHRTNLEGRGAR